MFKSMRICFVMLCVISLIQTSLSETAVRKCANGEPTPLSVHVNSCTKMPCDLWRGYSSNVTIQFVSKKNNVDNIAADISMTTLGIELPFILTSEQANVCMNLMYGAYCPMYEDEDATYHLVLDITRHQPEVPAKLKVVIKETSNDTVFACFILDARITNRYGALKTNFRKIGQN